jgi:hypothetical protein
LTIKTLKLLLRGNNVVKGSIASKEGAEKNSEQSAMGTVSLH